MMTPVKLLLATQCQRCSLVSLWKFLRRHWDGIGKNIAFRAEKLEIKLCLTAGEPWTKTYNVSEWWLLQL